MNGSTVVPDQQPDKIKLLNKRDSSRHVGTAYPLLPQVLLNGPRHDKTCLRGF